jgi:hypothetical protein
VLIYPNPLNPKRYIMINSGFTFREYPIDVLVPVLLVPIADMFTLWICDDSRLLENDFLPKVKVSPIWLCRPVPGRTNPISIGEPPSAPICSCSPFNRSVPRSFAGLGQKG